MYKNAPSILYIHNTASPWQSVEAVLHDHNFHVITADPGYLESIPVAQDTYHLVLYAIDGTDAVSTRHILARYINRVPVVIITAPEHERTAADMLVWGVSDYVLTTPAYSQRLGFTIRSAMDHWQLQARVDRTAANLSPLNRHGIVGNHKNIVGLTRRISALKQEIAERDLTELALRESESKFRTLTETLPAALFIAENTDQGIRLRYVNPATEALSGYTREELLAMDDSEALLADLSAMMGNRLWSISPGDQIPARSEMILHSKGGAAKWIMLSVVVIEFAGKPAILGTALDITGRKQVEADLEAERTLLARRVIERTADLSAANADLMRAARLKDEFLANMSHELRTPLNAILGLSEAMQEGVYGSVTEKQLKPLGYIKESGQHLLDLINDILDFSKIEAGKLVLDIMPICIETLCHTCLHIIDAPVRKKNLTLVFDKYSATLSIRADERRLKQVLINLLSNAVKFTPEGGTIGLEVTSDLQRRLVYFTVWDTGVGIQQNDMQLLFRPFVQLDGRLSKHYDGTGLGLALVYRMIKLHGGSISVESTPNQGSRFTIILPGCSSDISFKPLVSVSQIPAIQFDTPRDDQQSLASQQTNADVPVAGKTPIVLVAEDNEVNLVILVAGLTEAGFWVEVARNGIEAIEQARVLHPDLILMSLDLPERNGLEATRHIRAVDDLAHIPIITLTALVFPGDEARCLEAGVNAYMVKPINIHHVINMITTLVA